MKLIDNIWNQFLLKYYKVQVGKDFSCQGRLIIQGHGSYTIGNRVRIVSKETVNPIGGNRTVLQTLGNGEIRIGDGVGMSHAVLCARKQIVLEKDVMLGAGVKLYDTDFHAVDYTHRMESPDTHVKSAPIHVGEGAFIGAHSIILKGVTIGRHAVIGAGSVVTRDVPDGEVWAGNPARMIKKLET